MILFFDPGELNVQATVDNWPAHDRLFGAGNIRLPQTMQQSEFNCSIESRMWKLIESPAKWKWAIEKQQNDITAEQTNVRTAIGNFGQET